MSSKINRLRAIIREAILLSEEAAGVSTAKQHNLALATGVLHGYSVYALYDPRRAWHSLINDRTIGSESFYGVIEVENEPEFGSCHGARQVSAVAARRGWGPLMYDIAMADESPLMPDRSTVSDLAQKVWKHYNEKRPDVGKRPLDDIDNPSNSDSSDDCRVWKKPGKDYLDYAYYANFKLDLDELLINHDEFAGVVSMRYGLKPLSVENTILKAGRAFFSLEYQKNILGKNSAA